jgi:hypothetical protein
MTEETTNPVVEDDAVLNAGVDQDDQIDTDAEALESDEDQPEVEEEEYDEVERGGKTYKVPKALKAELLMQADYTRKTQELADQRKAIEARAATLADEDEAFLTARATTKAIETRIGQIEAITPDQWARIDAEDARNGTSRGRALDRELAQLKSQREQVGEAIKTHREQRDLAAQQDFAKQRENFVEVLKEKIGLTPELDDKLTNFAVSKGIAAAELQQLTDPRMGELLYLAFKGEEAVKKQMAAVRAAKAVKVQPAERVAGKGAAPPGLRDDLPADEWLRRRNEQLQRK